MEVQSNEIDLQSGVLDNPRVITSRIFDLETPSTPYSHNCTQVDWQTLMQQWHPTGYRVSVNLPYISNDRTGMFAIRVNPYIPWLGERVVDVGQRWKNFTWIRHDILSGVPTTGNILTSGITISQHSPPPIISSLAYAHRFWKGSMKFRLRVLTDMRASGTLVAFAARNLPRYFGEINPFSSQWNYWAPDDSYLSWMANSYVESDVSFNRHLEILVPWELPVEWYDQWQMLNSIHSRVSEAYAEGSSLYDRMMQHGDTWLVVATRGVISATTDSTMRIEIDYALGSDFQFSIPFVPPIFSTLTEKEVASEFALATVQQILLRTAPKPALVDGLSPNFYTWSQRTQESKEKKPKLPDTKVTDITPKPKPPATTPAKPAKSVEPPAKKTTVKGSSQVPFGSRFGERVFEDADMVSHSLYPILPL